MIKSVMLSIFVAAFLAAVEVQAQVVRVSDGDTIVVSLADASEAKIRLLYLDTPEAKSNSHGDEMPEGKLAAMFLRTLLPVGTTVTLWGPGAQLEQDRFQRLLAVAVIAPDDQGQSLVVQSAVIRAGWSVLWEKFGKADLRWRPELVKAETEAREESAGAWSTAKQWMTDKSNETTAPKAK